MPIHRFQNVNHNNARRLLVFLSYSPQPMTVIKDDLAARCGSMKGVERAHSFARNREWVERAPDGRWHITEAGRAELANKEAA